MYVSESGLTPTPEFVLLIVFEFGLFPGYGRSC